MTDYELLVVMNLGILNAVCGAILVFGGYSVIRFEGLRKSIAEAIQNGDTVYHWIDAKNFAYLLAGFLSAWFTMNLGGIFCYERMFDVGPMAFLGLFVAITFTLWGIAWRKP